jgi:hypothetical protein
VKRVSYPQLNKRAADLLQVALAYAEDGAQDSAIARAQQAIDCLKSAQAEKARLLRKAGADA